MLPTQLMTLFFCKFCVQHGFVVIFIQIYLPPVGIGASQIFKAPNPTERSLNTLTYHSIQRKVTVPLVHIGG
jgi:hypothetical protein